jgi:cellulose synthase/poly-beta-1,6-N-acetylglucosamine synthase-like glycosyltransferase
MSSPNGSDNHKKDKITKGFDFGDIGHDVDPAYKILFLNSLLTEKHLNYAAFLADQNDTNIETELIANQVISERDYFGCIAKQLDLRFLIDIDPSSIISSPSIDVLLSRNGPLRIQLNGRICTVISPSIAEFRQLERLIASKPQLKQNFAIAPSSTTREAVWQLNELDRVKSVVRELQDTQPHMSAKTLLSNWQSYFLGVLSLAACLLIYFQPGSIFIMLHASLTLIYLSFNLLKLSAGFYPYPEADPQRLPETTKTLPYYTILIAVYKEEQVAEQLIKAMSRLKWPKSKLDIKLICEVDDTATINALIDANPGPEFEIIKVPNMEPRTKPKALQYAMAGAKGDFIAVYDAEDRPHPEQLIEAYRWFDQSTENLGCMQAPLVITNADIGWLPGLFSLEYSGLFRRLIPLLSHFGLPIPLGGTSNHFRRSALLDVGGWDPCNVTEDADLGIRLYSHGYNTGVLKRPTLETAPTNISVWIKQRTRWLKGWMQTWLVFMRHPIQLLVKRGWVGFVIMQVMIGGMLIAALAHPFAFIFIGYTLYKALLGTFFGATTLELTLIYLDIFNLIGGYFIFVYVGMSALISGQKKKIKTRWLFLPPLYWLLMSFAGWRALSQLPLRSQFWEKTPHEPARRD